MYDKKPLRGRLRSGTEQSKRTNEAQDVPSVSHGMENAIYLFALLKETKKTEEKT